MALWQGLLSAIVLSWYLDVKLNSNTKIQLTITPVVVSYYNFCGRLPSIDTSQCSEEPKCNLKTKYRTIDGSCSNLEHPTWGQAGRTFARVVRATYDDGKSKPRRSVKGTPLPLVRTLSSAFYYDKFAPDQINTLNVMQWGQLIAHDVTHNLPNITRESGKSCCTSDNKVPAKGATSVNCLPMEVNSDDRFYSKYHVNCLNFSRAAYATSGVCYKYPIEQINIISSLLDGSMVYSSNTTEANKLRTFSKGRMKVQVAKDGRHFLPNSSNTPIPCTNSSICYLAGDDRVNQNTGITVYQIILLRLHNFLCKKLHKLNRNWNDERLYQEARRIVWAFIQHVTYTYFLPITLGIDYLKARDMNPDCYPFRCVNYYDPSVNPATFAEFAGSAYRSYHSMVPGEVLFVNKDFEAASYIKLDDYLFKPFYLQNPKVLDMCLRGLVSQPQQLMDLHVTDSVRNLLFKGSKKWGNDLVSTDLMRCRELGLPPYNKMRHLCGLKRAEKFEDFRDVMSEEAITKLKSYYCSVNDVDLYTGAQFERLLPGTLVGPTNQCIIGEQFYNYMRGDRFFYRNCGLPWSFTRAQLEAIYQTSIAWLFCEVGDEISAMPMNTFKRPCAGNPILSCRDIKGLNLGPWKE